MARVGVDARTGRPLYGWDHCVQSIKHILYTAIGKRVQRREFGSNLAEMIDRPQNAESIVDFYVTVAEALQPRTVEGRQYGEPGFVLLSVNLDASEPGVVRFNMAGVYFENGHLGDFSSPQLATIVYSVTEGVSP